VRLHSIAPVKAPKQIRWVSTHFGGNRNTQGDSLPQTLQIGISQLLDAIAWLLAAETPECARVGAHLSLVAQVCSRGWSEEEKEVSLDLAS
jgi:hypothetical protein